MMQNGSNDNSTAVNTNNNCSPSSSKKLSQQQVDEEVIPPNSNNMPAAAASVGATSSSNMEREDDDDCPSQNPSNLEESGDESNQSNDPGKMFIGGLSWQTSAENLRDYFCKFGDVNECMVMRDPATKRARGFGFITFADPSSVEKVLADEVHELDGKKIDPKVAFPKRTQPKVVKTKKVFIGGLSSNSTLEDMKNYFQQYGKIEDAMLMFDKSTQRHRGGIEQKMSEGTEYSWGFKQRNEVWGNLEERHVGQEIYISGFGFITFDDDDVSDKVCEIHFHEINGKMVECKKAQPKEVMLPVQLNKNRAAAARNLYGLAPEQLLAYASYIPRIPQYSNAGVLYPTIFNGFSPSTFGMSPSGRSSASNNGPVSSGSGGTNALMNARELAAVQQMAQQQAIYDATIAYANTMGGDFSAFHAHNSMAATSSSMHHPPQHHHGHMGINSNPNPNNNNNNHHHQHHHHHQQQAPSISSSSFNNKMG